MNKQPLQRRKGCFNVMFPHNIFRYRGKMNAKENVSI